MPLTSNSKAYSFSKNMLVGAGIWPTDNPSRIYKLKCYFSFFYLVTFAFSLCLSVIFVKEFTPLVQSWAMCISISNCCIKFGLFYYSVPRLDKLLQFLRCSYFDYYDEDLDCHIQEAVWWATLIAKVFFVSAALTITSFCAAPLASPGERLTPLPFFINLKDVSLVTYVSVYVFQTLALVNAAWTTVGFDNVATSMMALVIGYLKILKETLIRTVQVKTPNNKFQEVTYGTQDEVIGKKLEKIVECHAAVIELSETTESIFTYIVLLQFLASASGICLAGFTFINSQSGSHEFLFTLSLPVTLIIQISLFCTFGNEVSVQSVEVIDACYMTDWTNCGPQVRKALFIIMERAKRPLILTAGKFVNLSLASLVSVIKSAVSYAIVLRQLTHKET